VGNDPNQNNNQKEPVGVNNKLPEARGNLREEMGGKKGKSLQRGFPSN